MTVMPFIDRMTPPDPRHAFSLPASWVWCGSATCDDDGRYHLFTARWPRQLPFFTGYKVASEVVRAEAAQPEGPWQLAEVVLADRGPDWWDGRMTHNPTVIRIDGRWYLYYIGATYAGDRPAAAALADGSATELVQRSYDSIRIGCAWADHPAGPWHRPDAPCLDIRPGHWDGTVVTNPAVCRQPDGRILLYYRSNTATGCKLGVAIGDHPLGPFTRLSDEPILEADSDQGIEDPFIWHDGERFQMIAKDLTGRLAGAYGNGVHALSGDGIHWRFHQPVQAWNRDLVWTDGHRGLIGSFERPQLLFDAGGAPSHLFCAMADGPGGFRKATRTWNQVIRLQG